MDRYLLQLMLSKGIGNATLKKILEDVLTRNNHSFEDYCRDSVVLQRVLFRPKRIDETMLSLASNKAVAEKLIERLERNGIDMISELDDEYPEKLRISLGKDCPARLFTKGDKALLESCCIGFCGSRKVSKKGAVITEQCVCQLVNNNITVVSGHAGGTDITAHSAALKAGGNTIFVLAEGIMNIKVRSEVGEFLNGSNHLFVSQFLPDSIWSAQNAMRRNSVIIGLSKAMILVESGKSGGTFAAGEESLKRDMPLFVVDYAKPEVSAEANPYFIEHGGKPIRSKGGKPNLDAVINLPEIANEVLKSEQLSMF